MGGLRPPLRLTARSFRARFNTDCQKRQNSQPTIRVVLYDLRGVWQSPRFSKLLQNQLTLPCHASPETTDAMHAFLLFQIVDHLTRDAPTISDELPKK